MIINNNRDEQVFKAIYEPNLQCIHFQNVLINFVYIILKVFKNTVTGRVYVTKVEKCIRQRPDLRRKCRVRL